MMMRATRRKAIGMLSVIAAITVSGVALRSAPADITAQLDDDATTVPPQPTVAVDEAATTQSFDDQRFISRRAAVPESSAAEPSGNFRFACGFSHLAYDDPIVFPGAPGESHLHMFFGNTLAGAHSTYESLRAAGDGTCQGGPLNRSGYWAPALFNAAGKVIVPDDIIVYYKGNGVSAEQIQSIRTLPKGLRMIAGFEMDRPGAAPHFEWYCENGARKQPTIPRCPANEHVLVNLQFPSCWDGVNLDISDHRSHMAYFESDTSSGELSCPPSHPVILPEFRLTIWWPADRHSDLWRLSSDQMEGMKHASGSTFHADWFGAWDLSVQETWTTECINGMLNCDFGELGDGTRLIRGDFDYTGPRLLDPPPEP